MTDTALPKAMLIDLDDTILALSDTANRCWTTLATHYADQVNGGDVAALHAALLTARTWFWSDPVRHKPGRLDLVTARRTVVGQALEQLGVPNPALAAEMAQAYTAVQQSQIYPLPGALAAIHAPARPWRAAGAADQWRSARTTPQDRAVPTCAAV